MYTDPLTNITFPTWDDGEGYVFGLIVPDTALTTDEYDYIGYLVSTLPSSQCWMSYLQEFPELHNPFRSRRGMVWNLSRAIRADDPGPPPDGMALRRPGPDLLPLRLGVPGTRRVYWRCDAYHSCLVRQRHGL